MKPIMTSNSSWSKRDKNSKNRTEILWGSWSFTTWLLSTLCPFMKCQLFSIDLNLIRVMMIGVLSWGIKHLSLTPAQLLASSSLFVVREDLLLLVEMITLGTGRTIFFRWTSIRSHQQLRTSSMRYHQLCLTTWVWCWMTTRKSRR